MMKRMAKPTAQERTVARAMPRMAISGNIQKPVMSAQLSGMLMRFVTTELTMFQRVRVLDARMEPYEVRRPTKMKLKAMAERYSVAQEFWVAFIPSQSPIRPDRENRTRERSVPIAVEMKMF